MDFFILFFQGAIYIQRVRGDSEYTRNETTED